MNQQYIEKVQNINKKLIQAEYIIEYNSRLTGRERQQLHSFMNELVEDNLNKKAKIDELQEEVDKFKQQVE